MHLATDLKWAVSGRNESKLKAVVEECRELNPDRLPPGIAQQHSLLILYNPQADDYN
jgi:hypothetical protein